MAGRLLTTVVVLAVVGALAYTYARWKAGLRRPDELPPVGAELTAGAERTWVLFTTPYCATCRPVRDRIGTVDPSARIVEVDVAEHPDLARRYRVRTAPTVLLAGADGSVRARLIGNVAAAALDAALA